MRVSQLLYVAAAVCFAVALLITVGAAGGPDEAAWLAGGLLAFVLAHLSP